jgi:hypothetical protein
MRYWIIILGLLFASNLQAQVIVQTWMDPCTSTVQTVTFPLNGIGVTVVYRNQAKTFTAQQAAAGELLAWINQVTVSTPCPITNNPVVQQTVTQTATQAATQAVTTTASSVTSSTTSSVVGSTTSGATTTPTTSSPSSTSSSSPSNEQKSDTKSDSKSESKSDGKKSDEKKEEKKDDKKKSEQRTNPIMIASDLTTGQTSTGGLSEIITVGVSQSSLIGDKSYGATAMLWSTLDQGALSLSYTKMNFVKGKLNSISSYSSTSAYLKGTLMQMVGYTWIKPNPKFGIYGVSAGVIGLFTQNDHDYTFTDSLSITNHTKKYTNKYIFTVGDTLYIATRGYNSNWATSIVAFWMHPPIIISPRMTVSPQVFIMGSPLSYNSITGVTTNKTIGAMLGDSWDYKLTKRFGVTAAHRVMIPATGKPLNFLLIGSRMIL